MVKRFTWSVHHIIWGAVGFITLLVMILLSRYAYHMYRYTCEAPAHAAFDETVDLTMRSSYRSDDQGWERVAAAWEIGASKHACSGLYPYFLAYQAQALARANQHEQASTLAECVVDLVGQEGSYSLLARLNALRIQADTDDTTIRAHALDQLVALSQESVGASKALVLYHLAIVYQDAGQFDLARVALLDGLSLIGDNAQIAEQFNAMLETV